MNVSSSFFQRLHMIRQIPIFSKLSWMEAQKIARKALLVEFNKSDLISEQGAPADFFYCVISGRVQAFQTNRSGQQVNIEFVHRGMHFGIISALTGENHTQSFVALNDSVILKISRDDFDILLKAIPQLGIELSQNLSQRMHVHQEGNKGVFESSIISVYSPVKGAGGSTYAINLANSLATETRKRVLFMEIHSLRQELQEIDASAVVQWKIPQVGLRDIVGNDEKIHAHIYRDDCGFDVMCVGMDVTDPLAAKQISPFVSALVGEYHYVIVDLPSDMDDIVLETLTQSDLIHLIMVDQPSELQMVRKVIDRLEIALRESFQVDKIRVIIRSQKEQTYLSFEDMENSMDYPVYQLLPYVSGDGTRWLDSKCFKMLHMLSRKDYSKALRHIARDIGKVRVGIALGGGAALGLAHIGVIKVLEEENISIDVIVGSSMGALVGALWATGKSADQIEAIATEFKRFRDMIKLFDPVFPVSGLVGGRAIRRWLKKHLGTATFYSTQIPFKVVSYDLRKRQEIVMDSGSIVDAVHQSIAIPGIIEPIRQADKVIIDGGVLNPLPTNVLATMRVTRIIAVNVLQSPEHVSKGLDIRQRVLQKKLKRSFIKNPLAYVGFRAGLFFQRVFSPGIPDIIVQTLQASEYVIAEQSARQADVVIQPDLVGFNWYELNRYEALIKSGENATKACLAAIKTLIKVDV